MTTPEQFLTDFCKDLVAHPGKRPEFIKGYARLLDLRERATARDVLLKLKEEMAMHTVPEGRGLIARSYLNNTIDFEVAQLAAQKEDNDA